MHERTYKMYYVIYYWFLSYNQPSNFDYMYKTQINTINMEYISNFSYLKTGKGEKFVWEEYKVAWNTNEVSIDVLKIFF